MERTTTARPYGGSMPEIVKDQQGSHWAGMEGEGELRMPSEIPLGIGQALQDSVGLIGALGFYSECDGALWSFEQRRNDLVT